VIVENGQIRHLSTSQAEKFDPSQPGGCPLAWWFEAVQGHRREDSPATEDGRKGHALLAVYLSTGELPKGRVKMGKAVTGAIAKGLLPKPGPDILVEKRFSGQPRWTSEGKWVDLDVSRTLWIGGLPWDGDIDAQWRRDEPVNILDHKFSSDIHGNALPNEGLIRTVQLPVYALQALRTWPDATVFRLAHHYVARSGVDSFLRRQVVTLDRVLERKAEIETLVESMKSVAQLTDPREVPFNKRACQYRYGCPHQARCPRFMEKPTVQLTPEEMELFGMTPAAPAPTREPGSDDDDPTPIALPSSSGMDSPATFTASSSLTEDKTPVSAAGDSEPPAAVRPPDAPPSDPNTLPPEKKSKSNSRKPAPKPMDPEQAARIPALLVLPEQGVTQHVPPRPAVWSPSLIARALRAVADVLERG
jgi:hypothetical protein